MLKKSLVFLCTLLSFHTHHFPWLPHRAEVRIDSIHDGFLLGGVQRGRFMTDTAVVVVVCLGLLFPWYTCSHIAVASVSPLMFFLGDEGMVTQALRFC